MLAHTASHVVPPQLKVLNFAQQPGFSLFHKPNQVCRFRLFYLEHLKPRNYRQKFIEILSQSGRSHNWLWYYNRSHVCFRCWINIDIWKYITSSGRWTSVFRSNERAPSHWSITATVQVLLHGLPMWKYRTPWLILYRTGDHSAAAGARALTTHLTQWLRTLLRLLRRA
jgi:hypothetical protein